MYRLLNTIYYFYDTYVYRGFVAQTTPKDYAQEHSIVVITMLITLNVITFFRDQFKDGLLSNAWLNVAIAVGLYSILHKIYVPRLTRDSPSILNIMITILYILLTFVALFYFS